jgi:hypothetical protein
LIGVFTCHGASVVNGAQTVGTIGKNGELSKTNNDLEDPSAWVQVRIISLEKCPPDFSSAITRAANLQNTVGYREFAAMDPTQHRLAIDFTLDRRTYAYKQGDVEPRGNEGCSIVEATQALGSAHSVGLAVQVKREIGQIWADTQAPPYTDLFNEQLTSTYLWRSVLVMRAVDEELQILRGSSAHRADMVGIHLNRVILHLVFQDVRVKRLRHDSADQAALIEAARMATKDVFRPVTDYLQEHHEYDYLASLCKNHAKCEELTKTLLTGRKARQESFEW